LPSVEILQRSLCLLIRRWDTLAQSDRLPPCMPAFTNPAVRMPVSKRVGQKKHIELMATILSNLNQFSKKNLSLVDYLINVQ